MYMYTVICNDRVYLTQSSAVPYLRAPLRPVSSSPCPRLGSMMPPPRVTGGTLRSGHSPWRHPLARVVARIASWNESVATEQSGREDVIRTIQRLCFMIVRSSVGPGVLRLQVDSK